MLIRSPSINQVFIVIIIHSKMFNALHTKYCEHLTFYNTSTYNEYNRKIPKYVFVKNQMKLWPQNWSNYMLRLFLYLIILNIVYYFVLIKTHTICKMIIKIRMK